MSYAKSMFILIIAVFIALPGTAGAHGINGSFYGSYGARIDREIKPIIVRQLKAHHIYSAQRVARVLNIGWHESRWRIGTRRVGCVGPLQFNEQWTTGQSRAYWIRHGIRGPWIRDGRLSYEWSIHRIVHVYVAGGTSKVQDKWRATYWK